jgi:hypothetical protein
MPCKHFRVDKGFPSGVPNTEKEQFYFCSLNNALCAHQANSFAAIVEISKIREDLSIGYKQFCLFIQLSADIHGFVAMKAPPKKGGGSPVLRALGFTPKGPKEGSKRQDKRPDSPELEDNSKHSGVFLNERPDLLSLVRDYEGSFEEPLLPVFWQDKWTLQSFFVNK